MTNKELIERFYDEVFNSRDLSNLDQYMKDDYIQHNPTAESGKEGFIRFCDKFLAMKPHMEIKQIIAENDLVCVFFKCTMEANGMENKVFDLYRIENGKLAEQWDCVEHDIGKIAPLHDNGLF